MLHAVRAEAADHDSAGEAEEGLPEAAPEGALTCMPSSSKPPIKIPPPKTETKSQPSGGR